MCDSENKCQCSRGLSIAKKVNYGKPSGKLDTQLFKGWDPVGNHRKKMERQRKSKKAK